MTNSTRNNFNILTVTFKFYLGITIITIFFTFLFVTVLIYEPPLF